MNNLRTVQLRTDGPCPCVRGKKLQACCLTKDGKLRRKLDKLTPSGSVSGYSHPKCYLRQTDNCCETLSSEHYISKAVLAEIDTMFSLSFPWLAEGEVARVGINSMTANILCKRHNSALSELDTHARDFFRFVRISMEYASGKTSPKKPPVFLASGDAIELWAAKTLFGLYHAKIAAQQREILKGNYSVDVALFCSALANLCMTAPAGLYVTPNLGEYEGELHFAPLSVIADERVVGIQSRVGPVIMDTLLDPRGVNFPYLHVHYFYRPSAIHINTKNRSATIFMSWQDGITHKSVDIDLGRFDRNPKS